MEYFSLMNKDNKILDFSFEEEEPYGILPDHNRSLLFDLKEYDVQAIRDKIPRLGGDFNILANKLLTPEIRLDLINLQRFHFQNRDGIPEYRLEMAEKLINKQIRNILEGIPVQSF